MRLMDVSCHMLCSFFLLVQLTLKFSILCCVFQKVLAAHGFSKVSAYVTHAVFPKQSYERFLTSNSGNCQFSTSQFYSHSDFRHWLLIICSLQLGQVTSSLTSGSLTLALTM
jgi:hypothetical protein